MVRRAGWTIQRDCSPAVELQPPQASTSEGEDYQVELNGVSVLELALKPDLTPDNAFATLAMWRMA
jgi:hypothetical protein